MEPRLHPAYRMRKELDAHCSIPWILRNYPNTLSEYENNIALNGEPINCSFRNLTRKPNLAGTAAGKEVADYVYDQFVANGLDEVEYASYTVLLSYPDKERPSVVYTYDYKAYKNKSNYAILLFHRLYCQMTTPK